jgi:hypothetical protein
MLRFYFFAGCCSYGFVLKRMSSPIINACAGLRDVPLMIKGLNAEVSDTTDDATCIFACTIEEKIKLRRLMDFNKE